VFATMGFSLQAYKVSLYLSLSFCMLRGKSEHAERCVDKGVGHMTPAGEAENSHLQSRIRHSITFRELKHSACLKDT
jgi:hypothetical protein